MWPFTGEFNFAVETFVREQPTDRIVVYTYVCLNGREFSVTYSSTCQPIRVNNLFPGIPCCVLN